MKFRSFATVIIAAMLLPGCLGCGIMLLLTITTGEHQFINGTDDLKASVIAEDNDGQWFC
jgi:hypothetical protein